MVGAVLMLALLGEGSAQVKGQWNAWSVRSDIPQTITAPPTAPPLGILPLLTLDNTIPLEYYYVDDSNGGKGQRLAMCTTWSQLAPLPTPPGTHYKYSSSDIRARVSLALDLVQTANALTTPPPPPISIDRSVRMSHLSDLWLVHALRQYPVAGKSVVRPAEGEGGELIIYTPPSSDFL